MTLLSQLLPPDSFLPRTLSIALPMTRAQRDGATLTLTPLSGLGCIIGCLGGCVRVWCHRTLGYYFTWDIALRDNHKLITTGPYRLVRHPSYTGWLFLVAGNFALLASRGSYFVESGLSGTVAGRAVALANFVYCLVGMGNLMRRVGEEDRVLRKEFGGQWEAWARRTRYRLVPFVY